MSEIELPTCPVCQVDYDYDEAVPVVLDCGDTICQNCMKESYQDESEECPVCQDYTDFEEMPKNKKLAEVIGMMKKLKKRTEPPKDSLKCTGCRKIECESDLFICRECVKHWLHYDIMNDVSAHISDLESFAICGSCAIRVHISAGHETLPYFSIMAKVRFESHLTSVSFKKEELEQKVADSDVKYSKYKETINRAYEEIDKMTEMMRKSKSSEIQRKFAKRISEECNKIASYVDSVSNCISKEDDSYQLGFNELVATNLRDEVKKCQEIPERAPEFVCNVCGKKETKEKMMCCRKCSGAVKSLMSDTVDESNFDTIDPGTLPVCIPCALTKHFPGDHIVVKFTDVLDEYRDADNLMKLNKKVAEVNTKLGEFRKTFQDYIPLVESYDNKITKLSQIAAATRGHSQYGTIIARLDQCVKEAEPIINSLQKHAEFDKILLEGAVEQKTEE